MGILTAISSDDLFEAMAVNRPSVGLFLAKKIILSVLINVFRIQRVKLHDQFFSSCNKPIGVYLLP